MPNLLERYGDLMAKMYVWFFIVYLSLLVAGFIFGIGSAVLGSIGGLALVFVAGYWGYKNWFNDSPNKMTQEDNIHLKDEDSR